MNIKFTFKKTILLAFSYILLAGFQMINAQTNNVGINTTTPDASAALDIVSTTQGVLVPRMTATQRGLFANPAIGLMVYQTDAPAGFYFYNGNAWVNLTPSELQGIPTGPQRGYRILGKNAANYGTIGGNAVDLSTSSTASTTLGATGSISFATGNSTTASGDFSTAMGINVVAKSYGEVAMGTYNGDYTVAGVAFNAADRAFGVGIGSSSVNRKDGLIVYKDGTLAFNRLTTAPTTITNRFYVLNDKLNYNGAEVGGGASELQKLTESSKTGYRILGRDAANYGDTGSDAMDLSISGSASTTRGATGLNSIALGFNTTASGVASSAIGSSTTASGNSSVAMGDGVNAKSYAEVSVGLLNTLYTPNNNLNTDNRDRAFGVGIGIPESMGYTFIGMTIIPYIIPPFLKDGLVVYKSGNTFISNDANTPANGTTGIIEAANPAALQVRSSNRGVNLINPNDSPSMTMAKTATPSNGNIFVSFGSATSGVYSAIGSITANGSTGVSYNTASDARLKIDNGTYQKGLNTINDIKIHDYTWKEGKVKDVGVFAQELYKVYPRAVTKGDDATETDPTKIKERWQVDYSKLVPVLVAALQELSEKNATLEQKVKAIEKEKAALTAQLSEVAALKNDIEAIKAQLNTKSATLNK